MTATGVSALLLNPQFSYLFLLTGFLLFILYLDLLLVFNDCFTSFQYMELEMAKRLYIFGPARSSFSRSGPARNTIFNFRPVWARENLFGSMF